MKPEVAKQKEIAKEIARLRKMSTGELREQYAQVFGEETRSHNKPHLFRKIAYRLQEKAFGGVSERTRARARELLDESLVRTNRLVPHRGWKGPVQDSSPRDPRLPAVGTILTKEHRGRVYKVRVAEEGFEFEGKTYRSLSAVAREITSTHWNGYLFFGLTGRGE